MEYDEQEGDDLTRSQPAGGEHVRIIGAVPAPVAAEAALAAEGDVPGDEETSQAVGSHGIDVEATCVYVVSTEAAGDAGGSSGAAPDLPHWTEPPTGQVPAVLDRRGDDQGEDASAWAALGDNGPVWREHAHEWADAGFDPALLANDETRVGVLDEAVDEELRPWEFDDISRDGCDVETDGSIVLADDGIATSGDTGVLGAEPAGLGGEVGSVEAAAGSSPGGTVDDRPAWQGADAVDETDSGSPTGAMSRTRSRGAAGRRRRSSRAGANLKPSARDGSSTRRRGHGAGPRVPERGRSGRDLPVAIATGAGFGAVALACFAFGSVTSLALVTAVVFLAAAETFASLRRSGRHPATLLGLVAVIALMVAAYDRGLGAVAPVVVLVIMASFLWYLFGAEKGSPVDGVASTLFGFGWVGVLGSFGALLLAPSYFPQRHGIAFLLGAIIATVANDVGALSLGSLVGRHHLAPRVSPNKTWEGIAGGMILAVGASAGIVGLISPWTPASAALLGVVVAIVAPLGDLCESLIKRDLGVKDMGALLPGHGGVLDRVDALLFVLPATFYLVRVLKLG